MIIIINPQSVIPQVQGHSTGQVSHSPYVSVARDVNRAAATTDDWLQTIIHGRSYIPRYPSWTVGPPRPDVERAPDIGVFRVPTSKLHTPNNPLSQSETEELFLGDNLSLYLEYWLSNPYGRPPF